VQQPARQAPKSQRVNSLQNTLMNMKENSYLARVVLMPSLMPYRAKYSAAGTMGGVVEDRLLHW
jgi:hypothetical protein